MERLYLVCILLAAGIWPSGATIRPSVADGDAVRAEIPGRQEEASFDGPLMGWSSWNTYRIHISDELIRRQAAAMVALGLDRVGYRYINIDDGFFGRRDETGLLHTHPERFPDGMEGVIDCIHALGLKAGVYSDAGANTCGSLWDADPNGVGVGLYGHEAQDADLYFNRWGADFIKIDYCGAGQQLDLDERERYATICETIRRIADRRVRINICRWAFPGTWAREMADSWRISGDITPSWESVREIISRNLYLSAYAGGGHYNDMDMLEIGRGLRPEEEETHFGMWCIMGSPLLIGCDLTAIPEASLALLKNEELIALNQDPLGLQAHVVQHEDGGYVLVKDLLKRRGLVRAAALYNPTDTVCRFDVPLDRLELAGRVRVRDLVRRSDEGTVRDRIVCTLPPHGVKIVRLEAERRLEPNLYEAEWAYLPRFDDLGKRSRGIRYARFDGASGGMIVRNIGGSADNFAEWSEVYSERGGAYVMTLVFVRSAPERREVNDRLFRVEVNGEVAGTVRPDPNSGDTAIGALRLRIRLRPGFNVVRIGSPYSWTPDLDCFLLERL